CVRHGLPLVERLLRRAATDPDGIPRVPQDLARRRYFGRDVPQGGAVRWSDPAEQTERLVRACHYAPFSSPWGRPRATWAGRDLEILDAAIGNRAGREPPGTVRPGDGGSVLVASGRGWLELRRVRFDGADAR